MGSRWIAGPVVVVAVALALSACGDDAGDAAGTPEPERPRGVIEDLAAAVLGSDDVIVLARQMQVEERVAACMAEQGFEYVPVDYTGSGFFIPDEDEPEESTLAYAREYGYGITLGPRRTRAGSSRTGRSSTR